MNGEYSKEQVKRIYEKYTDIFKDCYAEYREYADIGNREYEKLGYIPFITSDFKQPIEGYYENVKDIIEIKDTLLKKRVATEIDASNWKEIYEFRKLNNIIKKTEIGTSIGVNKFTDDLILNWNASSKDAELVIMIGIPLLGKKKCLNLDSKFIL
ncbi:hypothetical protein MAL08_19630 (plasmid) [Leptospira noguchii]|uniref:hypothetical protein n=1 Tax=Leptospira noguchii TaxID=28182 RepID=UPI001FB59156|nr:hypothetical protein [Leptospira noguchii]UOG39959.1 hypothetical protein MAL08_19630 [Leptospira noguchii]